MGKLRPKKVKIIQPSSWLKLAGVSGVGQSRWDSVTTAEH